MNDENTYDEANATTRRLLETVCEGVILPTKEEEEEALDMQQD